MSEKSITLTVPLINGILQYLGTRPYGEVFQLVQAVQEQAAPQVKKPDAESEPSQAADQTEGA
jgi:hypothetical protein